MSLRPLTEADYPAVVELNHRNVAVTSEMDEARLAAMVAEADTAAVIEHDGRFAGFVITFGPRAAYDAVNYRWFGERYDDFCYLDRIVVHEDYRRFGLGRATYDELEAGAAPGRLACEVNLDPPNEPSLAFHAARGYREVGQQRYGAHDHLVSLLVKELP